MELPYYVEEVGGVLYCFLENEMDKNSFESQCKKCPLKDSCITKNDLYKNISGDWHSLNASGLYGEEFDKCTDKFKRKDIRDISKIVGLALCYGGTAYTVAGNMGNSKEEAQQKIDNFFNKLSTLSLYMLLTKKKVLETGKIYDLFGRESNMTKWAFSNSWKDKAYAQRVALNYPIQGSSAELLKIMMVRIDEYIEANRLSLLYGLDIPQSFDLNKISYKDQILHELMSTHDEIDFLFHEDYIDNLLPIIYEIMQIQDVMDAFGIGFNLELDCEYSKKYRSLLALDSYLSSRIYVINKVKQNMMIGGDKIIPNTIVIDLDGLKNSFLKELLTLSCEEGELYNLIISSESGYYLHKNKYPLKIVRGLKIKYKLAYIS